MKAEQTIGSFQETKSLQENPKESQKGESLLEELQKEHDRSFEAMRKNMAAYKLVIPGDRSAAVQFETGYPFLCPALTGTEGMVDPDLSAKIQQLDQQRREASSYGVYLSEVTATGAKSVTFVWRDLSPEEMSSCLATWGIPADCILRFEVCGGRVYVNTKTHEAWSKDVSENLTIILGSFGIGYGSMVSGHSLTRSLQSNRMKYLTWDDASYRAEGSKEFLPLLTNLSFLTSINNYSENPFSRYVQCKMALPKEKSPFDPIEDDLESIDSDPTEETEDADQEITISSVEPVDCEDQEQEHLSPSGARPEDSGTGKKEPEHQRPYFMRTDSDSLSNRFYWAMAERALLGRVDDPIPSVEEMAERDASTASQKRTSYMDPAILASLLKSILKETIAELFSHTEYFCAPSGRGFTSYANVKFEELMFFIMYGLGSKSTDSSITSFFAGRDVSKGQVDRMREQLTEDGMQFFFKEFNRKLMSSEQLAPLFEETLWGFRPLGIDGTSINVPKDTTDPDTVCKGARGSEYKQIHALCVYGFLSGIYHDVIAVGKKKADERTQLLKFLESYEGLSSKNEDDKNYLLVADRGFESWGIFTKLHMKGARFVFRIKDTHSNGILSQLDFGKSHSEEEFQKYIRVVFYGKGAKKHAPSGARPANFLGEEQVYEVFLRVVQFRLEKGGKLETLITNVPSYELSALQLEYLYRRRWEIETSFRTLKYKCQLAYFHGTKKDKVRQEMWGALTMFNFCSFLLGHIEPPKAKWSKGRKHEYAINRTMGIVLSTELLNGTIDADFFGRKIVTNLQPVRPNRSYVRNVRAQSEKSAQHRPTV